MLMDINVAQALRDLMQAGHCSWGCMVAPRITSVSFSFCLKTLEDLDKSLAIITEHNSHYNNMRVKDGAWLVDRIILSKVWLIQDDIKARTGGGRVFWDRFWGRSTWRVKALPTL